MQYSNHIFYLIFLSSTSILDIVKKLQNIKENLWSINMKV